MHVTPASGEYAAPTQELQGHTQFSQMFRESGFIDFLAKFDDAEGFDVTEANETGVKERFEAFKSLPAVANAVKEVVSQKVFEDLGVRPDEADLKGIEQALNQKVFVEKDFGYIKNLKGQVKDYKELPGKIQQLESKLAAMGTRESLEQAQTQAETKLQSAQSDWETGNKELGGLKHAEKGGELAKNLEKRLEGAPAHLAKEGIRVAEGWQHSFQALEKAQQKLLAADKLAGRQSLEPIPQLKILAEEFKKLGKLQDKPAEYLNALSASRMQSRLEGVLVALGAACQSRRENLSVPVEGETGPAKLSQEQQTALSLLEGAATELDGVVVDGSSEEVVLYLVQELRLVNGMRLEAGKLATDPSNETSTQKILQYGANMQTEAGSRIAQIVSRDLEPIQDLQEQIIEASVDGQAVKGAAKRANTKHPIPGVARLQKLFMENPVASAEVKVGEQESQVKMREAAKLTADRAIESFDSTYTSLGDAKRGYEEVKNGIFLSIDIVKETTKKAAKTKSGEVQKKLASNDIGEFFGGLSEMERLAKAKEKEPLSYGDPDAQGDDEPKIFENMTLKQVKSQIEKVVLKKLEAALTKWTEKMSASEMNPDTLHKNLREFELNLGSLAQNPNYKATKAKALKSLVAEGSKLPLNKKIALKVLLFEELRSGRSIFAAA